MCGRIIVKTPIAELARIFAGASPPAPEEGLAAKPPSWNGAPRQTYPLIIRGGDAGAPVFVAANWGFAPSWNRDETGGRRPINARSETVAGGGLFRDAYRTRRALLPVDGFYEWHTVRGGKQPYAIAMATGAPFALAAIWDAWTDPRLGARIRTFAVLTCPANALMTEVHHRMPVVLAPEDHDRWLSDAPDPRELLRPYPSEPMRMWPVSARVNSPRNDGPDLLERVPDPAAEPDAPAPVETPAQGHLF
jgi:putative SOS response-associated peptidase YedK